MRYHPCWSCINKDGWQQQMYRHWLKVFIAILCRWQWWLLPLLRWQLGCIDCGGWLHQWHWSNLHHVHVEQGCFESEFAEDLGGGGGFLERGLMATRRSCMPLPLPSSPGLKVALSSRLMLVMYLVWTVHFGWRCNETVRQARSPISSLAH